MEYTLYFLSFFAFLLGAFIGRYIAMVTYFLPQILFEKINKEPSDIIDWFFKDPICWKCNEKRDLFIKIPVISYFFSGIKCSHCGYSYIKSFILEIIVGLFLALLVLLFPIDASLFFVFITTCLFICCFLTDYDYGILPDQFTLTLIWVGLIGSLFPIFISSQQAIAGALIGYGLFWAMNEIYRFFRKQEGMFPGDFKLNAGVGACIGVHYLFLSLAFALLLLILTQIILYWSSNKKENFLKKEVAYGCYLSIVSVGFIFYLYFASLGGVYTP